MACCAARNQALRGYYCGKWVFPQKCCASTTAQQQLIISQIYMRVHTQHATKPPSIYQVPCYSFTINIILTDTTLQATENGE